MNPGTVLCFSGAWVVDVPALLGLEKCGEAGRQVAELEDKLDIQGQNSGSEQNAPSGNSWNTEGRRKDKKTGQANPGGLPRRSPDLSEWPIFGREIFAQERKKLRTHGLVQAM